MLKWSSGIDSSSNRNLKLGWNEEREKGIFRGWQKQLNFTSCDRHGQNLSTESTPGSPFLSDFSVLSSPWREIWECAVSSRALWKETDLRSPKWGKTKKKYVNSKSCSSFSPRKSKPYFLRKNQHKFDTTHCISSRGRRLKKLRAWNTCFPLCSNSQCGRKTFITSVHSTLLPWPPIPHLNWALKSHWFHQQNKE